jgi:hypothetical protein
MQRSRKPRSAPQRAADSRTGHEHDLNASSPDSLRRLTTQLGELREYTAYYVRAKVDRFKLSLRQAVSSTALILILAFALCAVICVSIWLLLSGLAEGVGRVLGDRLWLGNVLVAALVLSGLGATIWILLVRREKREYLNTVKQYEQRCRDQKAKFGQSVQERSQASRTRNSTSMPDSTASHDGANSRNGGV